MDNKKVYDAYTIKNQSRIITVPSGTTILTEGEVNLDMYNLIKGNVEMYIGYGTDNEVLLGILGPGACFGEFGLLLHKSAIYTIITFSEVQLLRVAESDLESFVKANPGCIVNIMKNMANVMLTLQKNISLLSDDIELMKNLSEKFDEVLKSESKQMEKKDILREYAVTGQYYSDINSR